MTTPHQSPDGIEAGRFQTSGVNDTAVEMKNTGRGDGSARAAGMPPYGFAHQPPMQALAHKRPMIEG